MTRSQRIKTIVKLSENRERTAAREFAAAQKVLNDYKDRILQLQGYREEYLEYLKPNGEILTAGKIQDRQAFILQIDEGIRLLSEQVRIQETMNSRERDKWLRQKQQLDTMENIYERFRNTERRIIELREQHHMDELSQGQARKY